MWPQRGKRHEIEVSRHERDIGSPLGAECHVAEFEKGDKVLLSRHGFYMVEVFDGPHITTFLAS